MVREMVQCVTLVLHENRKLFLPVWSRSLHGRKNNFSNAYEEISLEYFSGSIIRIEIVMMLCSRF